MKSGNGLNLNKYHPIAAQLWLAICVILLVTLVVKWPSFRISANVMALLPTNTFKNIPPGLTTNIMNQLDKQVVWLVGVPETWSTQEQQRVATWWKAKLSKLSAFKRVIGQLDDSYKQEWFAFYTQYRNNMIDPQTRSRLVSKDSTQVDWVISQLYLAFSGVSSKELTTDPLLLTRSTQLYLQQYADKLQMENDWLIKKGGDGYCWYLIRGELSDSVYNMKLTEQTIDRLNQLEKELSHSWPTVKILKNGAVFYSDYAARQAKADISILGSVTIIGVFLLLFLAFRSFLPLLLSAMSISVGLFVGTAMTLLCFGEIHLMTLVMSISIIGLSADYTLYYLTERMIHGKENSPYQSLYKILPTLLMALATTLFAYLVTLLVSFPGLRQLAVFSIFGLSAACLTVICWLPYGVKWLPVRKVVSSKLALIWLSLWQNKLMFRYGVPLSLLIFSLIGIVKLEINDDIRQLQALPYQLLQQEKEINALIGENHSQQWFVIYGDNAELALQRVEALTHDLQQAQKNKWFKSIRTLPLSSIKQQREDLVNLKKLMPIMLQRYQELGITIDPPYSSGDVVTPEMWLNNAASEGWRLMMLHQANGQTVVFLPVIGVENSQALTHLAASHAGVMWLDKADLFNDLFSYYHKLLTGILLLALITIIVSYVLRLGCYQGMINSIPPLLSIISALGLLGFLGFPLNLFSLLALILVLGVGVNYTFFFNNIKMMPMTALMAITLAFLTTILTLGILVFSRTAAISSFGTVLSWGLLTAFLLSPLALPVKRNEK